jgi:hypothetical protein
MITINLQLNLPTENLEKGTVVSVFFKNRTNIIGTCSIEQNEQGTIGSLTVADELHDSLYVFYVYGAVKDQVILEGILFDDSSTNKTINTVGSSKVS